MVTVETKTLKLDKIKLNPDNPRLISTKDMDRLVKSLQEFPEMLNIREIVVDETMMVLGGNARTMALRKIGAKECRAKIVTGLTDEQKREFIIKDNTGFGEFDLDILANAWGDLPLLEWGVDLPEDWLTSPAADGTADAEPQIDLAEELNKTWGVKSGDLWQIGEHRLLCGDSTKKEDVERVMGGEKADMVFTDPPYNVDYVGKTKDALKIANDAMTDEQFDSFLDSVFAAWLLRPGGSYYVCAPPGHTETQFRCALNRASGLSIRQCIVWVKNVFVMGRQDYQWKHESILYGWREGAAHYFIDDRTQDTVWEIDRPSASKEHPTMKPVALPVRAINNSSKVGEIIFDGFGGSGTTMIACENTGRKCRMVELPPTKDNPATYCAVILQRMTDAFPGIEIRRIEP